MSDPTAAQQEQAASPSPIHPAFDPYFKSIENARSKKPIRTYRTALHAFCAMLSGQDVDTGQVAAQCLDIQNIDALIV